MDEGREIATQRVRHTLKFVRTQSSGSSLFLGPSKEWSNELIAEQCPSRIILLRLRPSDSGAGIQSAAATRPEP